ncbi:hypothetical protein ACFLYU_00615 [Candidatus Dependentiae bacterium]
MKKSLKLFICLFSMSFALLANAAKIVFFNLTGEKLIIKYRGKTFEIKALESGESTRKPYGLNRITTSEFEYKIGKGKYFLHEIQEKMKYVPYIGNPSYHAVVGNKVRPIYIFGENIVDDDIKHVILDKTYLDIIKKGVFELARRARKLTISLVGTLVKQFLRKTIKEDFMFKGTKTKLINKKMREDGKTVSKFEIDAIKEREKKIRGEQEKFLGVKFLKKQKPLSIGFVGSGGGVRARLSTTGFVYGASKIKLLDCITYFSALSGSTWMLAPWIMKKGSIDIEDFYKIVIEESKLPEGLKTILSKSGFKLSNNPIATIKSFLGSVLMQNYARVVGWGRPHGLVNFFGSILPNAFLKNVVSVYKNPGYCYLSDVQDKVGKGDCFVPIFEVRARKEEGRFGKISYQPCHFTPWEFGGRWFGSKGAYVPIKTFGSNFNKKGEAVPSKKYGRIGPEPDLGLVMGVCGSAFTAPFSTLIMKSAPKIAKYFKFKKVKKEEYKPEQVTDKSLFECEFNNFMKNNRKYRGFNHQGRLHLYDSGIDINLPIISLYRRPKDELHLVKEGAPPEVIVIFDASHSEIGSQLLKAKKEIEFKGLPFPEVKLTYDVKVKVAQNGVYIFDKKPKEKNYNDWEVPTVIYFPLVRGKSEFRFKMKDYGTFNFAYSKAKSSGIMKMTKLNIEKAKKYIGYAMLKRVIINLKRDLAIRKELDKKSDGLKDGSKKELLYKIRQEFPEAEELEKKIKELTQKLKKLEKGLKIKKKEKVEDEEDYELI